MKREVDYKRMGEDLVSILYLTRDEETGKPVLDPDKEWSSDTLEEIGILMERYGLTPKRRVIKK